jgi:hypothetical protein
MITNVVITDNFLITMEGGMSYVFGNPSMKLSKNI